ncbi:MAG: ABC transporter ATP-binding protein [Armatimonadota bacterium]|nr:ABC transporter ATP-binding protein [Armatimonadota bacterium]
MSVPELRAEGLTRRFGGLTAVAGISLTLARGEILSVVGPNGAGKTTLLNLITGVLPAEAGAVWLRERLITGLTPDTIARAGVVRTFQQPRLFRSMTVLENCMAGAFRHARCSLLAGALGLPSSRQASRRARALAESCLRRVGLEHAADLQADVLTTGQQRLLEVARALSARPTVLLLDEPAAGLDDDETARLGALIRSVCDEGYAVLLIEHDMHLVMGISDRVLVMNEGRPVTTGTPEQVRHHPDVIACYLGEAA